MTLVQWGCQACVSFIEHFADSFICVAYLANDLCVLVHEHGGLQGLQHAAGVKSVPASMCSSGCPAQIATIPRIWRCQAQHVVAYLRAQAAMRLCSCADEQLSGSFLALPAGAVESV